MQYKAKNIIGNKYYIYAIFLTLVILVNGILLYKMGVPKPVWDAREYESIAESIMRGDFKADFYSGADFALVVTPVFPAIVALLYSVFGHNPIVVIIYNILCEIITVILIYRILNKYTNQYISLIMVSMLILYFPLWLGNMGIMMEISSVLLLIISIYLLDKYFDNKKISTFVLFSTIFSFLVFMNNRFLFLYIGLVFIMLFIWYLKYTEIKFHYFVYIGVLLVILIPWHIRQYYVFEKVVFFAPNRLSAAKDMHTSGEIKGSIDVFRKFSDHEFKPYEVLIDEINNSGFGKERLDEYKNEFTKEKYSEMVLEYKSKNNFEHYIDRALLFWQIANTSTMFLPGDGRLIINDNNKVVIADIIILTPIFLFFIPGLILSFYNKNILMIIISLFVIIHWAVHILVLYLVRYRVIIIPLILIVGSYGLYSIYILIKDKFIVDKRKNIKNNIIS